IERRLDARRSLRASDPAMIDSNADRGETETDRRDAAEVSGLPVADHAVRGVGLVPEVVEAELLQIVEDLIRRRRLGDGRGQDESGENDRKQPFHGVLPLSDLERES